SARAPARAVPDGGPRVPVARDLQRAAQGAGPSGGAAGDRSRLQAPPGLPGRLVPPDRAGPRGCTAPRAPDLRRLLRLPPAQPATAPSAQAAVGVRGLRRAPDQAPGPGPAAP